MYTLQAWAGIRLSLHHSAHSLELQVEVEKQMMLHKMDQTFLTLNVFFFFFQKTTVTRRGREGESIIGIFQLLRLLVSFCLALSIPAMKSNPVKLRFILQLIKDLNLDMNFLFLSDRVIKVIQKGRSPFEVVQGYFSKADLKCGTQKLQNLVRSLGKIYFYNCDVTQKYNVM